MKQWREIFFVGELSSPSSTSGGKLPGGSKSGIGSSIIFGAAGAMGALASSHGKLFARVCLVPHAKLDGMFAKTPMCQHSPETTCQLFLACKAVKRHWRLIFYPVHGYSPSILGEEQPMSDPLASG
jgi:hypothetical protein